jgi:hypothetical protein
VCLVRELIRMKRIYFSFFFKMKPFYSTFSKQNRIALFFSLVEEYNRVESFRSLFGWKVI